MFATSLISELFTFTTAGQIVAIQTDGLFGLLVDRRHIASNRSGLSKHPPRACPTSASKDPDHEAVRDGVFRQPGAVRSRRISRRTLTGRRRSDSSIYCLQRTSKDQNLSKRPRWLRPERRLVRKLHRPISDLIIRWYYRTFYLFGSELLTLLSCITLELVPCVKDARIKCFEKYKRSSLQGTRRLEARWTRARWSAESQNHTWWKCRPADLRTAAKGHPKAWLGKRVLLSAQTDHSRT